MPDKKENYLDRKKAFLLLFTLQLILHSANRINELKQIIKSETEGQIPLSVIPKEIFPKPKEKTEPLEEDERMIRSVLSQEPKAGQGTEKEGVSAMKPVEIKTPRMEIAENPRYPNQILRIPEPRLPPEFQYLRPIPVAREIDLGKLNPLIYDRAVQAIECSGPDKPIVVSGSMGRKPTEITLSNEELEDIVQRFSSASKIPAEIGVYKVVVGRLIFSAVLSDVMPSRFVIRKMYMQNPPTSLYKNPNPNYRLFFRK